MKKHPLWNPLLALLGTVSSLFCLISGLKLPLQSPGLLICMWILTAIAAQRNPLPSLSLSLVWLWDWEGIVPVFRFLGLALLSAWGLVPAPSQPEWVDSAAGLWGSLQLVLLCTALTGGKHIGGAVLTMLLPTLFCLMLPEAEPDSLPLFCLLAVVLLLLLSDSARTESAAQALRMMKLAVLPVLLSLSILFLCFPRRTYVNHSDILLSRCTGLLGRQLAVPVWITGADTGVNLQHITGSNPKNTPILEVTSNCTGILYLRMQDFSNYTGNSWQNSFSRQEILSGTGQPLEHIRIRTFQAMPQLLPCWPGEDTLLLNGAAAQAAPAEYTLERFAPVPSPPPVPAYLSLPEITRSGAESILDTIGASRDIPKVIGQYVRQAAQYDRNPAPLPEDHPDFALWFLEEAETGCCLHFATAAAVLLRAAGIPARLVTGFLVETQAGETIPVTEGHAWVEYYVNSQWQILDATPSADIPAPSEAEPTPGSSSPAYLLALVSWIPLQRWIRLFVRRRKQHCGSPNRRALSLFREASLLSRRWNLPLPQNLIDIAEKAQYSQHSITPQELAAFAGFRQHCRKTKIPLPKRLWERYVHCL